MKLQPAAFNRFLRGIGQDVTWRRSLDCPCRDIYSGAAMPNCLQCHGKGQIWLAPVTAYTGLSSMAASKQWANFGVWEQGDVMLTIPGDSPLYQAGQYDQVILTNSSEPFSLTMTRGQNDVFNWPVVGLDRVFFLGLDDEDNQVIVDSALPTVNSDGTLTWPDTGTVPEVGQQFSITGRRRPVYFLYQDLPSDRAHHAGQPLPRKVVARTFDLFGR
jgi:hypothetical protein